MIYPGGIGTLAQTIQAGLPHLVVPHAHDQPDNAARVQKLGLGTFIYPERYRGPAVAATLKELLSDAQVLARCKQFAGRIQPDMALAETCRLIESLAPQGN